MRIEGTTSQTGEGTLQSQATKTRDEFLTLFVAQLKNQDPLEPQKNSEFVAQLAQFAQLEQTAFINERLAMMEAQQATITGTSLGTLVGTQMTMKADTVVVSGPNSTPPPLVVELGGAATNVTVSILDADGSEVRRIELGPKGPGVHDVGWDGKLLDGTTLPPGTYTIEVDAVGSTGGGVIAKPLLKGTLEAVEFMGGSPQLRFGLFMVTPADVLALGQ